MKRGRPQSVILTQAEGQKLARLYLASNANATSGSATMAARVFAAGCEPLAAALDKRASKHSLPSAVWEAVAPAKHLVGMNREGDRALRNAVYTPGRLRLSPCGTRRLFAGEQACADDGTINFGVCVPWPWGGCPCSEAFGVKLGRFQLLLPHDDATSYIPAWNYVIRPEQQYTKVDVTGLLLRVMRDVALYDRLLLEGGSWQSKRVLGMLKALGIGLVDVKGRPQDKLVENFFNRFWTRLSMELPQASVGRFRGEEKRISELYVAGRAGKKDPRKTFPMLEEAMRAIELCIRWMNSEPIESRTYGTWVPVERWTRDMAEHPRPVVVDEHLWLASPVMEERVVIKGTVKVTAPGPCGLQTPFHFQSPDLWSHQGKRVLVAFDPMANPCTAVIADVDKHQRLCEAVCVDPWAMGDATDAIAQAKALRQMMRREYRVLLPDKVTGVQRVHVSETEIRTKDRMIEVRSGDAASEPVEETKPAESSVRAERAAVATPESRASSADLFGSLRRRAGAIKETEHAW